MFRSLLVIIVKIHYITFILFRNRLGTGYRKHIQNNFYYGVMHPVARFHCFQLFWSYRRHISLDCKPLSALNMSLICRNAFFCYRLVIENEAVVDFNNRNYGSSLKLKKKGSCRSSFHKLNSSENIWKCRISPQKYSYMKGWNVCTPKPTSHRKIGTKNAYLRHYIRKIS
jgi:hypothetical protein